jgi:cell division protein FtsB
VIKKLKRMFGISAPRVAVRTEIPWYLRWLGTIAVVIVVLLVARYALEVRFAGFDRTEAERQLEQLKESNARLEAEIGQLRGDLTQHERQQQIEHVTYADLVKQMKALSEDNAKLKEDLAFFQSWMPSSGKEDGVTVNLFRVQNDALPGEYHYRLFLTQSGQRARDFRGSLQFVVNLQHDGKAAAITLPGETEKDTKAYQLNFRFYQRVEGTFRVDPQAAVRSVQVRVFEDGGKEPRLTQTANVS